MKTAFAFLRDENGATSIEYALIGCGVALAIISAVNGLGINLSARYESVRAALQ
jgi:pilus assembly protein Flp/PilA